MLQQHTSVFNHTMLYSFLETKTIHFNLITAHGDVYISETNFNLIAADVSFTRFHSQTITWNNAD